MGSPFLESSFRSHQPQWREFETHSHLIMEMFFTYFEDKIVENWELSIG